MTAKMILRDSGSATFQGCKITTFSSCAGSQRRPEAYNEHTAKEKCFPKCSIKVQHFCLAMLVAVIIQCQVSLEIRSHLLHRAKYWKRMWYEDIISRTITDVNSLYLGGNTISIGLQVQSHEPSLQQNCLAFNPEKGCDVDNADNQSDNKVMLMRVAHAANVTSTFPNTVYQCFYRTVL